MSSYPQVGNNNVAGQHHCPNPLCNLFFLSLDDVCTHLSALGAPCTIWTQDLVHNLFGRDAVQHVEEDFDNGDEFVFTEMEEKKKSKSKKKNKLFLIVF